MLTVFHDGACPLCRKEIGLMRRLVPQGSLSFEDVSPADAAPSCAIDRHRLMVRFHVRLADGTMVDGARAFTEAWSRVPALRWLRPLGRFAATRWVLNRIYDGFLVIRPVLQWLAGKH